MSIIYDEHNYSSQLKKNLHFSFMKKILRTRLFTILILGWIFPCVCFSQQYVFKNFDTQQGLPSSEVYNCFQDAKGKIWFLTDRGLSMYDGYSFQNFSTKDGLLDNTLLNYSKVSDSLVWISSLNNQLVLLNTNEDSFEPYIYNQKIKDFLLKSELPNTNFNNFMILPDHSLFAGLTLSRKLLVDSKGITNKVSRQNAKNNYLHHYTSPKGEIKMYKGGLNDTLSVKNYSHIYIKSEKFTRYNSLKLNKQLTVISDDNHLILYRNGEIFTKKDSESQILNIGKFYNNQFWVSYIGNGVDVFDENGVLQQHFLAEKSVTSLLIDHKQSFWATTLNSGVYYCKNPKLNFYQISATNNIHSLTTKNDTLYVATYNGIIFQYHNRTLLPVYTSNYNLPIIIEANEIINDVIFFDGRNSYSLFGKQQIATSYVRVFSDASKDSLYSYGSIPMMHVKNAKNIETKRIAESKTLKTRVTLDILPYKGKLLFATNSELFSSPNGDIVLFEGRVNDIDLFQDDFAIATSEKGVVWFKDEKPFLSITEENGLYSNQISELLVENNSIIWACSNAGVNRIEIINDTIATISGLSHTENLGIEVNDVEVVNDTLWIATKKGLFSYPTSTIKSIEEKPHFFTLEEITVNDEKRTRQELTELSHDENAIFIRYNYVLFDNNNTVEYRYQFEGEDWVYTKNREIRLNNVPAVRENFIIQARERLGVWTNKNQLILPIHITAAFWTTWWFKSLLACAIGLLIYFFFKIRVLTYNKDIIRGLLMSLFNRVKTEKLAITIKSDGQHIKLFSSDILYVQSSGNYIEIFTKEKSHVTRGTIKSFQKELPDKINYLQIHRSYLVRLDKINAHNYTSVTINELSIPIGKTYQKEVNKTLLK